MEGGPPRFPRGSSCPAVLGVILRSCIGFAYGVLTLYDRPSHAVRLPMQFLTPSSRCSGLPVCPATPTRQRLQPLTPRWFGLLRVRSPLLAESRLFSSPRGTEMFQFPRLPPCTYAFSARYRPMTAGGFPHSDIHGSTLAYSSPWRIGVRPVLHRLLAPRHPPCALPIFTCRRSPLTFPRQKRLSVSSFQGTSRKLPPMVSHGSRPLKTEHA